ncbi:hypothetical protein FOPG_08549 [Fusarium oxysporum f. sp. conglutinans race 2 54008]|uniref:Uncharacterized protein n=1 Tax=Fusarium oxysporum f. sp. conglutinans race 2 54008 TaxID=1089457 RepID=X0HKB3_FUSOX|nr:hypothetical protein FOPG_08549 [Fusarium oxysporum f. sp. conglutinans race 2 54008]KAG6987604.1 hypothetical protein FocnCong_v002190 [Fusarium oxysporum f. sp. conglutinans]
MRELDAALYTIAWIAPLEIEAQAARHMLDNRHDGKFPISRGDDYVFLAGDINGHNIVIATLPPGQEYGTGSAAALASQIKKFFTKTSNFLYSRIPLTLQSQQCSLACGQASGWIPSGSGAGGSSPPSRDYSP